MFNCPVCNRSVPDRAAFCPYCGARFDAPAPQPKEEKPKKKINKQKMVIAICAVVIVLAILGAVLAVLFLIPHRSKINTFDFTCSEYTEKVNRIIGKNMLSEDKWEINDAHAVYQADTFTIDLDTDLDTRHISKISVSPADTEDGVKLAAVSLMVIETETTQDQALDRVAAYKNAEKNAFEFEPDENHHLKPPSDPTTVPADSSAKKEYTAEDFVSLTPYEIIDIMGGEFSCEHDKGVIYYTDGGFYIHNYDVLPGFVFYLKGRPESDYAESHDTKTIHDNIANHAYPDLELNFIALYDSAKLTPSISADMTYREFSSAYKTVEATVLPGAGFPGQSITSFNDRLDRVMIFYPQFSDEIYSTGSTAISEELMNSANPKIHAIVAFPTKSEGVETQPPTTEPETDWKSLYQQYVTETEPNAEHSYALVNIDDDGIPELVIDSVIHGQGKSLCWISGGELHTQNLGLASGEFRYDEGQGKFWNMFNAQGAGYTLYSFKSGELTTLHTASYSTSSKPMYQVDNEEASKDSYEAMVNEITSQCTQEPVFVSRDEIIQAIEQY